MAEPRHSTVVRNPRLAFNAAEEDCCSCVTTPKPWVCDLRGDGICRCFPLASDALDEQHEGA